MPPLDVKVQPMRAWITCNLMGDPTGTPAMTLFDTLRYIGDVLGVKICHYHRGRFHFTVGEDRTVAVSSDSAGRLRVENCYLTVALDRKWVAAHDRARLAQVVRSAAEDQTPVGVTR